MKPATVCTVPIAWYDDVLDGWKGRLGTSGCPGTYRGIFRDLEGLSSERVEVIYCLLEDKDFDGLRVPDLIDEYEEAGFEVHRLPIPDFGVPSVEEMRRLVEAIRLSVREGRTALVHCAAGIGRTGAVVACFLVHAAAFSPLRAIETVRAHRPGSLENWEQETFVHDFECAMASPK